jgi:hypothetical protein
MKNIQFPVYFTTAYLIVYVLLAQVQQTAFLIPWMFIFSPFLVCWMVYCILKHGEESSKTFDESFYEDWDGK